jgi:hypothetical protein
MDTFTAVNGIVLNSETHELTGVRRMNLKLTLEFFEDLKTVFLFNTVAML